MSRSVCAETSSFFLNKHKTEGVRFKLGVSVEDIKDHNQQKQIICSDGTSLITDAVVIGIGVKPNIKLAFNSGIECKNGITVDQYGQTSDINIFAAGDCTNHPNKIINQRLRLESVQNAVEQAKSVAAKILRVEKPYNQVPWFWSDQYNIKLKIAGISGGYDQYVVRGDIAQEKFSVIYQKKKKVIAIDAINDQKAFKTGKMLIESKANIPIKMLSNNKIDLRELISKT